MNLTVDQMDVLNFRLTEVSLELLGNSFYDIFGQKCDTLSSLHRKKAGATSRESAIGSDLVAALNCEDIFGDNGGPPEESHNANTWNVDNKTLEIGSSSDTDEGDATEHKDKREQREHDRRNELKITKIMNDVEEEYTRLLMCSESTKMKYFITNKHRMETDYEDEYEICNRFHVQENAELMAQSDAFIKLIKYIKCDSRNEFKMGQIAANILKVKDHISNSNNTFSSR